MTKLVMMMLAMATRQEKLPAEAHELVVTEAGQRAAHPDIEQEESENFGDEPEDRERWR